jgi:hypothetical protein
LSDAGSWDVPPLFDESVHELPPEGLLLPEGFISMYRQNSALDQD